MSPRRPRPRGRAPWPIRSLLIAGLLGGLQCSPDATPEDPPSLMVFLGAQAICRQQVRRVTLRLISDRVSQPLLDQDIDPANPLPVSTAVVLPAGSHILEALFLLQDGGGTEQVRQALRLPGGSAGRVGLVLPCVCRGVPCDDSASCAEVPVGSGQARCVPLQTCGDAVCGGGETCDTCAADCGPCAASPAGAAGAAGASGAAGGGGAGAAGTLSGSSGQSGAPGQSGAGGAGQAGQGGAGGCTALECSDLGSQACGKKGDGCGGELACGACPEGQSCGASKANVCGGGAIECDLLTGNGCPAHRPKCTLFSSSLSCTVPGPGVDGEPCALVGSSSDGCAAGHLCSGGETICRKLCQTDAQCPATHECKGLIQSVPPEASTDNFCTPRPKPCDTVQQDCPGGQGCYPTLDGDICASAGDNGAGQPCALPNDCTPGFACTGTKLGKFTCLRICDPDKKTCPAGKSCASLGKNGVCI